jgi:hypothetical protein
MVARNVGKSVVAVSCDQSLNSDASPTPTTVRFNQRGRTSNEVAGMVDQYLSIELPPTVHASCYITRL